LVAEYRTALISDVYQRIGQWLNANYNANLSEREAVRISRGEDTVWQLLQDQPAHFLPTGVASWKDYELAILDEVIESWLDETGTLTERAEWRRVNDVVISHPLSGALPSVLRGFLDMEDIPLNGATNMPLVQYGSLGASERIVVTPSMERQGLYNMPGGQSGNPFSPFYRIGHRAWATAEALPILNSGNDYELTIMPQ
jgi:penicillin amidase